MVNQVGGREDWRFSFSPSIGLAGGILCCRDKTVFHASKYVNEQNFVAVKG